MSDVAVKSMFLRNTVLSAAVHLAAIVAMVLLSMASCDANRKPREIVMFTSFQQGAPPPPPAPVAPPTPEVEQPKPADIPDKIPDQVKKPETAKTNQVVKISTNRVVRRVVADKSDTPKAPTRKLSATELKALLSQGLSPSGSATHGSGPYSSSSSAGWGTGGGSSGEADPFGWYYAIVRTTMYDAWQQPSALAGKQGMVTTVLIRVQRDGTIMKKEKINGSGNALMDDSVMKAVQSVNRIQELPFGFAGAYKDITVDFELGAGGM